MPSGGREELDVYQAFPHKHASWRSRLNGWSGVPLRAHTSQNWNMAPPRAATSMAMRTVLLKRTEGGILLPQKQGSRAAANHLKAHNSFPQGTPAEKASGGLGPGSRAAASFHSESLCTWSIS